MAGEFNFRKFAKFLRSFWGILASFTVVLPTIIYFSNTTQIKNSVLAEFYIGVPTSFALIAIPFVFLYEDRLSSISTVRRSSIVFIVISFISLFSFMAIKSIFIKDRVHSYTDANGKIVRVSTCWLKTLTFLFYAAIFQRMNWKTPKEIWSQNIS